MMKRFALPILVVVALSLVAAGRHGRVTAQAQSPAPQSNMQGMMKMHEAMMADMKAGDAKLDALVKTMSAASGTAKVDAIAEVVNELVRQNKAMHAHMNQMHQQMMGMGGPMMMK